MQRKRAAAGEGTAPDGDSLEPTLVRLNKYLADHGVASRRKCDELIEKGKVTVDDDVITELGLKVDPERQRVEVDGVVLKPERTRLRYYLLHKPRGVVCTNERREARMRAIDLITDPDKGRIYTVGRLDEDSQGLIMLTNDGEFANRVAHPRYGVNKTYSVKLRGRVEPDAIEKVRKGIWLSEGRTAPAFVKVLKRTSEWSLITITLNEGKNREVRRVFAAVGYNVLQLRRTHIGTLSDRSLKEGKWRPLLREEVREILERSREVADAAETVDKREDPRTKHFASGPAAPGRERRSPKNRDKWMRDRKKLFERMQEPSAPAGRRQRGAKRESLLDARRERLREQERQRGGATRRAPTGRPATDRGGATQGRPTQGRPTQGRPTQGRPTQGRDDGPARGGRSGASVRFPTRRAPEERPNSSSSPAGRLPQRSTRGDRTEGQRGRGRPGVDRPGGGRPSGGRQGGGRQGGARGRA